MNTKSEAEMPQQRIVVDPELFPALEEFRKEDHRKSVTNAANALIVKGLEAWRQAKPHTTPFASTG